MQISGCLIDEKRASNNNNAVRILHISSARQFGATECHIVEVCRALHKKGHDVFVALRPTNEWQNMLDFLPRGNVFHVSIRNAFGVLSAKRLATYVKKHEIQIVHAHVPRDYFPGSLACNLTKTARFVLSRHHPQPLKPFNRFALKNLSAAIVSSNETERSLSTLFPPNKIRSVPYGIDLEYLNRLDKSALAKEFRAFHGIPQDAFVVAMIGDLSDEGGQRNFVLAASEMVKTNPRIHFVLIGTDQTASQIHRRELSRLAEILGLSEKFLWLDHAGDSYGIFSATDVLIPCGQWQYPRREVLEAISLGSIVLQAKAPESKPFCDIDEVIIERPEALAISEAIQRIRDDSQLRTRLLNGLTKFVVDKHSIGSTVDEIEKLYLELR